MKTEHLLSVLRNLRQFACDGNEITYIPSSMILMDNLRLITAKNTWLMPELAKDESSTKPQVKFQLLNILIERLTFVFD